MAGTDQLDIAFRGVGGHGSTPQMTIAPVVMAAQAVLADQTTVSRSLDPQTAAVVPVGSIVAGRDNNVIPEASVLKVNLRWFALDVRELMLKRMKSTPAWRLRPVQADQSHIRTTIPTFSSTWRNTDWRQSWSGDDVEHARVTLTAPG